MNIAALLNQFRISSDPARQQAMVDAYIPILRPILIPACGCYRVGGGGGGGGSDILSMLFGAFQRRSRLICSLFVPGLRCVNSDRPQAGQV